MVVLTNFYAKIDRKDSVLQGGYQLKNIQLLDCTLRDGGYINDWNFGSDELVSIFERMVNAGVDIIETGFLDGRRSFDINRSIMPDTDCVQKIYGKVDKMRAMVVGMIDYGTCPIENLTPCEDSYLDGIRVIFKKHRMKEAIAFCAKVKELGYRVFVQAVSITSYSDEEMYELVEEVNRIQPYAVSVVDTYGLLHQDNLLHYLNILNERVCSSTGIGYHSHNNFQLGYANCMEMLEMEADRTLIVDATLYGMGKSAGNTPIELIAMHLNEKYGKKYDISQMLEAIDGNIMKIYQKSPWGYNLFYYLAASNKCHPNYVQFLLDKHMLSMKSINEILDVIEPEKKLMYDQAYIEKLYTEYQCTEIDDTDDLRRLGGALKDRTVLLVGPGKNLEREKEEVSGFLRRNKPVVIAVNFIPDAFGVDYVFLSNVRRYIGLNNALKEGRNRDTQVIATSNVTKIKGQFHYTLNSSWLLDLEGDVLDHSFIMLLRAMIRINVGKVYCAGFDGYSETEENYLKSDMEYWFTRRKVAEFNGYAVRCLKEFEDKLEVNFITDSVYQGSRR